MMTFKARPSALLLGSSLVLVSAVLGNLPAGAVVVNVQGQNYDVLVTNRSYASEPSLFNASSMPWFTGDKDSKDAAYDFALAVGAMLGSNNYSGFASLGGPLFAHAVEAGNVYSVFQDLDNSSIQNDLTVDTSTAYNFAYVKSVAVPGPLPLAAAAVGLGWSRQLRRRLRAGCRRGPQR
jgi:hypothetical protein